VALAQPQPPTDCDEQPAAAFEIINNTNTNLSIPTGGSAISVNQVNNVTVSNNNGALPANGGSVTVKYCWNPANNDSTASITVPAYLSDGSKFGSFKASAPITCIFGNCSLSGSVSYSDAAPAGYRVDLYVYNNSNGNSASFTIRPKPSSGTAINSAF